MHSPTERRNPATVDIDQRDSLAILRLINDADQQVPAAVGKSLPLLAEVVDAAVRAIQDGGRLHYFGAGTSGCLAKLDAAELPGTYGISPDLVVAHHVADAEDDDALGAADAADVTGLDVVVGLAASGRTPYVGGALRAARAAGAFTALISSNPAAPLADLADSHVCLDTGPEVIAGSTRMKAGTAQKLALHSLSTAVMVRLGCTYSNLMVSVVATNEKLRARQLRILVEATGHDEQRCAAALAASGNEVKLALVSLLTEAPLAAAREALAGSGHVVRDALRLLGGQHAPE